MKKKSIEHTQLLLLKLLSSEDMYGYQIILELARRSSNVFEMKEGTLYPVLHGMEREGYVEAYEKAAPTGRVRKYYHLTRRPCRAHRRGESLAGVQRRGERRAALCVKKGEAMDRKEYCDRVLAQVGRLTSDEANDLRNELAGHIEDHAEALVEHGYTEEDAAARAVELMGDPEETGRALREQYRHFWLVIVQRIAIFVTVVACVQGFFMLPMLGGVYESIRERVSPAVNSISWEELDGAADLHERILVGDDIVQLNRIEYGVREGERQRCSG